MSETVWQIVIGIVGTTYSVIFGIVAMKVWSVPKTVEAQLKAFQETLDKKFLRIDNESKQAHRRLNVHDRISSKITGVDFDSRAVAESGIFPVVKESR